MFEKQVNTFNNLTHKQALGNYEEKNGDGVMLVSLVITWEDSNSSSHGPEMVHGWVNTHREEEEPTEDFLNDENEPENGETGIQDMWRGAGHFDLNSSFLICSQHLNTASTPTTTIPPPTGVHELLECHVCTNSMYPPAYSLG
ncbi:hypothetical protein IFM89_026455 [Coptis chinensis]|uniref:Uncharacterized protein n=1 Tax=Coptis chinensis TaxID=261450 RepID=A0A835H8H9_9MAGN|nr:hypothetical protein IFM89_026455 [Coptis chinensis]